MNVLTKTDLRMVVKSGLKNLERTEIIMQSRDIEQILFQDNHFLAARSVGLFMNMPLEVETQRMIEFCFREKKKVYLPKCMANERGKMDFIEVERYEDVLGLKPEGPYGLKEPAMKSTLSTLERLDLIIVPGVAFTKSGLRLGHGGGYYDRYLTNYYKRHGVLPYLIGIGLSQQIVDSIPVNDNDWSMNRVITAQGA